MAVVRAAFTLVGTTGSGETFSIKANTTTILNVFYGADGDGNPVAVPVDDDSRSFSFIIKNGKVPLQMIVDLNGFPGEGITIQQQTPAGVADLDFFVANPSSLIWSPTIEGKPPATEGT